MKRICNHPNRCSSSISFPKSSPHSSTSYQASLKKNGRDPRFVPVLSAFAWALPRAFRSTPAPENTCVTLTIGGESGGRWSLLRQAGEWKLYQGAPDQPDAEVLLDEDLAWRLFTRGLSQDAARRQLSLRGDRALALQVLEMVSIIA